MQRRQFIISTATAACAVGALGQATAAESTVINYGGSAWLGHYPVYVGIKAGLFAAHGLEVKWTAFGTSSSRLSALLSGNIDMAGTGIVSALALMSRGSKHFQIVGTPEDFGRVEGLFVRSDVTSVQSLKGKKIGVTFASSSHLLVLDLLASAGLNPDKDVSLLNVPAPELVAALQSKQIDAAAVWTPHFNRIRAMPDTKLLADDTAFSLYKQFGVTPGPDVLVVRSEFAVKNSEAVRRFIQTYFSACAMLRDKPVEMAKHLTELTNLTLDDQIATIKEASWYDIGQQQSLLKAPGKFVDGVQKLADLLTAHKQIDKSPSVKDWINVSYL
ncbi:ABC transporter substrate-binding protein [Rhodoferax sp.]|uniref:ABC transporter substrate-binding protein n=1 Tax=Rhodoferax sp. TaxID=50421 RepID=UPI002621F119|nr:ABC transporter substrate-binding protein [Rhodoferax sp.]MDD3937389.1 ABC transporter substrate-binding protein [Rhodoferax sp.]